MKKKSEAKREGLSKIVKWTYLGTKIVCDSIEEYGKGQVVNASSKQAG